MLEGHVVIRDCGCFVIRDLLNHEVILRSYRCAGHGEEVLDFLEWMLYLDKVDSVSAPTETEEQLWLT